jgi:hypothetical protein
MRGRVGTAGLVAGLVLLLGTLACCSRSVGADEVCRGPDLLTVPISGADAVVVGDGTCSFEDEQGGYQHRIICDTESCRWYVDETLSCTCQQLDFSNTCSNGVPGCADWHSSFDFASFD